MDGSSSFSSSQYTNLLETVTDLRNDLEKAVSEMQLLRESNDSLKRHSETIEDQLIETRKKYNEAQENYMTTVASKLETERQYEEFLSKKSYELEEKTNEFEQLRDKFTPQDVDYIRIKVNIY